MNARREVSLFGLRRDDSRSVVARQDRNFLAQSCVWFVVVVVVDVVVVVVVLIHCLESGWDLRSLAVATLRALDKVSVDDVVVNSTDVQSHSNPRLFFFFVFNYSFHLDRVWRKKKEGREFNHGIPQCAIRDMAKCFFPSSSSSSSVLSIRRRKTLCDANNVCCERTIPRPTMEQRHAAAGSLHLRRVNQV